MNVPPSRRRPGSPPVSPAPTQPMPGDVIANALRTQGGYPGLVVQHAPLRFGPEPAFQPAPAQPASPRPSNPLSAREAYELGLTCAALGETEEALAAFRHATASDPAFRPAWHALAQSLKQAGDGAGAKDAIEKAGATPHAADSAPPRRVPAQKVAAAERDLRLAHKTLSRDVAEFSLRERLKTVPTDIAALHVLAASLSVQGRQQAAERLFQRAVDLAPDYEPVRHAYAICLYEQGKRALALPHAEWLLAQDPRSAAYRALAGACLAGIGQFSRAASLYRGLVEAMPAHVDLWGSYASALQSLGRRDEAVQAYRTCLSLGGRLGEAYWNLASANPNALPQDSIATIERHLAGHGLNTPDRSLLHYALGRILERAGEYEASFAHYAAGARARRSIIEYSAEETERRLQQYRNFFTADAFTARAGWGCPDPSPIFVVGMPRAGSTLIEQILASHSAVEGTMELSEMSNIMADLSGGRSDRAGQACARLASMNPEDLNALGQAYLARTRIYRQTGKPVFIDKMPFNWAYVGLIKLILPNARIIDARRDPMANCFAAFKQSFVEGQAFTYDLNELGRFYRTYATMMAHMDIVRPGSIHRVTYEDLVADTETQVRRLLDFCGLDFEPACLRFWENSRAVSTISLDQVRRPIYRDSVDLWRHYAPWLKPLEEALGSESPGP